MKYIFAILVLFVLSSCASSKKISYLKDVSQSETMDIVRTGIPKIVPDDILSIRVSSSQPELAAPFNIDKNVASSRQLQDRQIDGYIVNSNGSINLPVLGEVQAAGMTREEFVRSVQDKLKDYMPDPIVIASFVNFKVMVMGEVMRPGAVSVLSDRITLLEAISMAGDMSIYGKRENVLVIREVDGKRVMERIDLQSKKLFTSPYFYLQQNDIVYVEPVKVKAQQTSSFRSNLPLIISSSSLLSSLILMIVTLAK